MNHKKFEFMFRKKHTAHMHAHPSRHTHAHHAHMHDSLYASVYSCTHCDRTGHLAKFCYDKLNTTKFSSKHVWVRKYTNLHGLKKVWVSKSTHIVFDVGVGSHTT